MEMGVYIYLCVCACVRVLVWMCGVCVRIIVYIYKGLRISENNP